MESINEYIELSFRNYPNSQEIEDIKNNLKLNCNNHYQDLTSKGYSESAAFKEVIASIGNIDDIIKEYRNNHEITNDNVTVCKDLYFELNSCDLSFHPGSTFDMMITSRKPFEINEKDDHIIIKEPTNNYSHSKIEVIVPSAIRTLEIDNKSGDIEMTNIKINDLKISSLSGDVDIDNCTIKNTSITTTSGDIDIVTNSDISYLYIKKTSGDCDIKCHQNIAQMEIRSTSGDIDIVTNGDFVNYNIESVSGDIEMKINHVEGINFTYQSISGDITNRHPHVDKNPLNIKNISGDISIN